MLFGALLGGAAAFFLSPKSGKENREMAAKTVKDLKSRYEGKSVDEIAEDVFGKATEESKKMVSKARDEFNKKIDEIKDQAGKIDNKKYRKIVDDVLANLNIDKKTQKQAVSKLKEYFLDRWQSVEGELEEAEKKEETKGKKISKKAN